MFSRKSIRLKNFDYSIPAAYFITIRIEQCGHLFGIVDNEKMELNKLGEKAKEFWLKIPAHYSNIILDEFIIMPNHIHGIIMMFERGKSVLSKGVRKNALKTSNTFYSELSPKQGTLGVIIREFKASFTSWCRKNGFEGFKWHRNYYDRIIRNEKELTNIRGYIMNNPIKWAWERENPTD